MTEQNGFAPAPKIASKNVHGGAEKRNRQILLFCRFKAQEDAMSHPVPSHRAISRMAAARLPAYAAFVSSVAFAAAIVFGFLG